MTPEKSDSAPYQCGMPLPILMALDAALQDGSITRTDAMAIVETMKGKQGERQ